jgi:hypothetical protein
MIGYSKPEASFMVRSQEELAENGVAIWQPLEDWESPANKLLGDWLL